MTRIYPYDGSFEKKPVSIPSFMPFPFDHFEVLNLIFIMYKWTEKEKKNCYFYFSREKLSSFPSHNEISWKMLSSIDDLWLLDEIIRLK